MMPVALNMLAVAVFAQATSEFMLAGLVPEIATELAISTAAAGSLTSAFAAGMIVGAPSATRAKNRGQLRRDDP
jgi:DHA1 family chloramphenicol resistance protein-like MFS transporter